MKFKHVKHDCNFYEYGNIAPKAYGAFCVYGPIVTMTEDLCKSCKKYERRAKTIESKSNISVEPKSSS